MGQIFHGSRISNIEITDTLFGGYLTLVAEKIVPYQWNILNGKVAGAKISHCMENFRIAAGEREGQHSGVVFGDTDAYKWLETVAYCIANGKGAGLEPLADTLIELIGRAQESDGYLNTYYTIDHPSEKWTNLAEGHELYNAGHLIEAAVAYYRATGKTALLDIAVKCADLICRIFGADGEKPDGCPGHPEIELALIKLRDATQNDAYLGMARHFVRVRGASPNYLLDELERLADNRIFPEFVDYDAKYAQTHLPPVEQTSAEGHAVRAMYLYSAMADLAAVCEDADLAAACAVLWDNVTRKKMYITGGIGASAYLERFTADYDLPNDRMYCESCASVGLMMFGQRMASLTGKAAFYDEVERALCNTVLGGVAMTGDRYFYVNPLEVWPPNCLPSTSMAHVKPVRQKWFDVACCPTNIARTLASLGQYIYAENDEALYVNMLISSRILTELNGGTLTVTVDSTFMRDGRVNISVSSDRPQKIRVRIPRYFANPHFASSVAFPEPGADGYTELSAPGGTHTFCLQGEVTPAFFASNEQVRADAGRLALVMGPYVYCLEEADNGGNLANIFVKPETEIEVGRSCEDIPGSLPLLHFGGERVTKAIEEDGDLYGTPLFRRTGTRLTAVPYGLWNNRTPGEMTVWLKALL
ncbi:MAG: glycoside hydrolase family 127 protein [Clostridiales Family XIII bacterium]|jgi:DUF1680 family protein|nr:glycoside hydrolase family 127 protein [Clostridiales Family XIII bacterium]